MDKIRILLDEDVHAALSTILQKRGFDVVHAQEVDKKGISDAEQLEYAVNERRCLISFNVKDYVLLHNDYVRQEKEHWSIITYQVPVTFLGVELDREATDIALCIGRPAFTGHGGETDEQLGLFADL